MFEASKSDQFQLFYLRKTDTSFSRQSRLR